MGLSEEEIVVRFAHPGGQSGINEIIKPASKGEN
jgi:hypothetical protein